MPEWRARLEACGLDRLSGLLERPLPGLLPGGWEALTKPGLRGRARWRWRLPGEKPDVVYVKRYDRTPLNQQADRLRRQCPHHSRAYWEFAQARRLARMHIPVARAVGFAEQMCGLLERRSVVLLEAAPGDGCDRVWQRLSAAHAPVTRGAARHDFVVRLARFVAAFHGTGFCHRDLYLCHVFVDLDPQAARPPRFTLIDLARTHRPRCRRMRWLIKDLAQLDVSARQSGATRTDRWRFLRAYLNLPPGAPRTRWYARRILRKSERILRRQTRKSTGP